MAIIFGDSSANMIAAPASGDTVYGFGGNDTLSTFWERADLRGGRGQDAVSGSLGADITGAAPYVPPINWSFQGGQGADRLTADVSITASDGDNDFSDPISALILLDGGSGDDAIAASVIAEEVDEFSHSFLPDFVDFDTTVVDLSGNNTVDLFQRAIFTDVPIDISNTVRLGRGNDDVSIDTYSDAWNWNGSSRHDVDLGNGDNTLRLSDRSGYTDMNVASGSGADDIAITLLVDDGNSAGYFGDLDLRTGAGDDIVAISGNGQYSEDGGMRMIVDLGSGANTATISTPYSGNLQLNSGNGADRINVLWSNEATANNQGSVLAIDAGGGNNVIDVTIVNEAYQYYYDPSNYAYANVTTSSGDDLISLVGGEGNLVHAGGGEDTITAGSGSDRITGGAGSDEVHIDAAIFDGREVDDPATERLTITDLSLVGGDSVVLSGWNLPALAGSTIDDPADLAALATPSGDVVSFAQTGADALLTLDLGDGRVGEILFEGVTIPEPADPPMALSGTNANDGLTGGNNDDLIFLRRGNDTATGGDGADVFRFNAVSAHNRNGDHHVITDLDFASGDTLLFNNFGATWADDSVDPPNALEYLAGAFNTWIVDSLADLEELRDAGAVSVTSLGAAGSQLDWTDLAGQAVSTELLGIFI